MIREEDILFVTNSLHTKWMYYQSKLIKDFFPKSDHLIIDGSTKDFKLNWPNSWFYHLDEIKKTNKKYYVHIDEDFFITSKEELSKAIEKLEDNNIDLLGCSDGYHHFRGANPIAINTFLMIGRVEHIKKLEIDLKKAKFQLGSYDKYTYSWFNSFGIKFKENYKNDFRYKFRIQGGFNFQNEHEPYYSFLWMMKELGCKFDYLYPHFDDRFKSTNPRLSEDSDDIGIHMWYARQWNSEMDVWGMKNIDRYNEVEKYLISNFNFKESK